MIVNPFFAFINQLGPMELLIIFFVILLLFGAKRLPELARGLGKSMKEFKKATSEVEQDFREAMDNTDPNKPAPPPPAKPAEHAQPAQGNSAS